MSYITKLQAELAAARAEIEAMREQVVEFRAHITADKFCGFDADGTPRNYINTRDVDARLINILLAGEG